MSTNVAFCWPYNIVSFIVTIVNITLSWFSVLTGTVYWNNMTSMLFVIKCSDVKVYKMVQNFGNVLWMTFLIVVDKTKAVKLKVVLLVL